MYNVLWQPTERHWWSDTICQFHFKVGITLVSTDSVLQGSCMCKFATCAAHGLYTLFVCNSSRSYTHKTSMYTSDEAVMRSGVVQCIADVHRLQDLLFG